MRVDEVLILERKDLIVGQNKRDFGNIILDNFDLPFKKIINKYAIVLFIDENGQKKIIKNRYGDEDDHLIYNRLMNKYELSIDRYIEAEKFLVFLGKMKYWDRLFLKTKIIMYLAHTLKKYNF